MRPKRRKVRPSTARDIDRQADTPHRLFFEQRSEEEYRRQRPPHYSAR
ncbi:hypothetical protein [Corynebacterium oculi]|uniref:Uncharacterized protein n=1 Tax=Corynebacterium oculi TaxID=1544416 RepID=A0A0Q0U7V8_9CORY|nr:hypothetical protein [Corynebacterium oculi]KQB83539.1 hypothetical protein Cocul_01608 [Corynebacterium oculi]